MLEAHSTTSVDDLLRLGNGQLLLGTLQGGFSDALEAARRLAPLAARVRDPLIHTSFLNSYASGLALAGEYANALKVAEDEMEQQPTTGSTSYSRTRASTQPQRCGDSADSGSA